MLRHANGSTRASKTIRRYNTRSARREDSEKDGDTSGTYRPEDDEEYESSEEEEEQEPKNVKGKKSRKKDDEDYKEEQSTKPQANPRAKRAAHAQPRATPQQFRTNRMVVGPGHASLSLPPCPAFLYPPKKRHVSSRVPELSAEELYRFVTLNLYNDQQFTAITKKEKDNTPEVTKVEPVDGVPVPSNGLLAKPEKQTHLPEDAVATLNGTSSSTEGNQSNNKDQKDGGGNKFNGNTNGNGGHGGSNGSSNGSNGGDDERHPQNQSDGEKKRKRKDGNEKRRKRRTAKEIDRKFRCELGNCQKAYGTEGALKMHIKGKHPNARQGPHSRLAYPGMGGIPPFMMSPFPFNMSAPPQILPQPAASPIGHPKPTQPLPNAPPSVPMFYPIYPYPAQQPSGLFNIPPSGQPAASSSQMYSETFPASYSHTTTSTPTTSSSTQTVSTTATTVTKTLEFIDIPFVKISIGHFREKARGGSLVARIHFANKCFEWEISTLDSVHKACIPFDSVSGFGVELLQDQGTRLTIEVTKPPRFQKFSLQQAGWVDCEDFTEQQASRCRRHVLKFKADTIMTPLKQLIESDARIERLSHIALPSLDSPYFDHIACDLDDEGSNDSDDEDRDTQGDEEDDDNSEEDENEEERGQ